MRNGALGWLRKRWGVRTAAALSATVLVGISLTLAGIALVLLQGLSVRSSVENQVRAHAVSAANRLASGMSPAAAVATGSSGFEVLQVLDGDGTVLAASPQLVGAPPLHPAQTSVPDIVADHPGSPLLDDGPLLVVERAIPTNSGVRVVLAAGSLAAAARGTQTVTELITFGVPLLALIAGAVTYAFAGHALRPVEAIRAQVAAMTDRDLGRRVPEPVSRDEVGRLARTMNDMLARLESTRNAQRRFVADASHELRSPLAVITARLELGLHRGLTSTDLASMMGEAQRMNRLIEDLLLLARADERGLAPRHDDVDLDELLDNEAARLRETTTTIQLRVHTTPVRVTGDRTQLARALRNLTDNAARHTATQVSLRLREQAGEAVVEVIDDGEGIAARDRTRVFDRFVRLDEGRDRDTGGTGLGLAIVAEVVAAHGGHIEACTAEGGGALLSMRLPAQPEPTSALRPAQPPSGSTSESTAGSRATPSWLGRMR